MPVAVDADSGIFQEFMTRLSTGLSLLPDKPEETPDSTLRALWHAAANAPVSVQKSTTLALPTLDAAGLKRLQLLIEQRVAGVPLAHLTGRQGLR